MKQMDAMYLNSMFLKLGMLSRKIWFNVMVELLTLSIFVNTYNYIYHSF